MRFYFKTSQLTRVASIRFIVNYRVALNNFFKQMPFKDRGNFCYRGREWCRIYCFHAVVNFAVDSMKFFSTIIEQYIL